MGRLGILEDLGGIGWGFWKISRSMMGIAEDFDKYDGDFGRFQGLCLGF